VLSEYNANVYQRSVINTAEVKLNSNPEIIIGIHDLNKDLLALTLFPNPTSNYCNLNYTLQNNEFVKVTIYNTLGELVYIETKNCNAGNVNHVININDLPSGNYSVQVSFKNNNITKKLTVIK